MAFDDAVRAAAAVDAQDDIRALVPQLSGMMIDEEGNTLDDDVHHHDDGHHHEEEKNEAQEVQIAHDNVDDDIVMMD